MKNLSGFLVNFKEQIEALENTYNEILKNIPVNAWSFGGGTALAIYHFEHRMSFDIDIFVNDVQYFSYLSPKWFIDDSEVFKSNYAESATNIKLTTKNDIKVDFIVSPNLTNIKPSKNDKLDLGFDFYVDSIEEIISKKIRYRKEMNLTRDIFDIALAITKDSTLFKRLQSNNTINLDEIFVWQNALSELNQKEYLNEIDIVSPVDEFKNIAVNAKDIILSGIDELMRVKNIELKEFDLKEDI